MLSSAFKLSYILIVTLSCFGFGVIPIVSGLDPSWIYALNRFSRDGILWGRNVVFTYVPLGWLSSIIPLGNSVPAGLAFWGFTTVFAGIFFAHVLFSKAAADINSRSNNILASFFMFYLAYVLGGEKIAADTYSAAVFIGRNSISFLTLSLLAYGWHTMTA